MKKIIRHAKLSNMTGNRIDSQEPLRLQNSLTGTKEIFKPRDPDGVVSMYVCGPTVYGPLHMGHARTYIAFDMLKGYLEHFRNEVNRVLYISNITDVGHMVGDADEGDDKIAKKARLERKHPMEVVDEYIRDMWAGVDGLLCDRPNIAPRATSHIPEIIDAVQMLIDKGYAYELNGSVYFDTSKFGQYLQLSGNKVQDLDEDVRIQSKDAKRNPTDFSLWKRAEPEHIMQWTSPW
jgi:cysteinyl-tRNA synthetase